MRDIPWIVVCVLFVIVYGVQVRSKNIKAGKTDSNLTEQNKNYTVAQSFDQTLDKVIPRNESDTNYTYYSTQKSPETQIELIDKNVNETFSLNKSSTNNMRKKHRTKSRHNHKRHKDILGLNAHGRFFTKLS